MLTGIEFTGEGNVRIAQANCDKGRFRVDKRLRASFNAPLIGITPKAVKSLLRQHKISPNKILIILPDGLDKSMIWRDSAAERESVKGIRVKMREFAKANEEYIGTDKEASIRLGFTGEADGANYGIVSSVPYAELDAINKAFKSFNVKYILPRMAVFSLIAFTPGHKYTAVMELNENVLTLAVYSKRVLIWFQSFPCPEGRLYSEASVLNMALDAVTAARNNYMYPTKIYLTGDLAGLDSMSSLLTKELEVNYPVASYGVVHSAALAQCESKLSRSARCITRINCEIPGGYAITPEQTGFLTLFGAMRGLDCE